MTYISAFHCNGGIVMCADTQETVESEKEYSEKLYIAGDQNYPLAIGGAGLGEAADALSQEIIERANAAQPATIKELRSLIKASIENVYTKDVPISAWGRQYRTAQYLIAAKPRNDRFVIFKIVGRRVWLVEESVIIGYATAVNKALLKRLYRRNLPMQQAVMLAVYLVSMSKDIDAFVGGETRVAVVVENGASIDDPEFIKHAESRVREFLRLTDGFFLDSVDGSLNPSAFSEKMEEFKTKIVSGREEYMRWSAARTLQRTFSDPSYKGDPYPKAFPGAVTTLMGDGSVRVREDTPEEIEDRKRIFEAGRQGFNALAGSQLQSLIAGRQVLYIGEEKIQVRGTAGPVPESTKS
jgi:20S proteasome alpha/beta subunit